ncbi:MAG: sensor histidine kinase, partial [Candidatus Cloacimonetes bacterium]|nr:sensor histidine kinase [Candidatus Cloacimonadota bacterium]
EIYHRTKNNMQVISSMLKMQARTTDNEFVKTTFMELNNKIKAMAMVHQKLYKAKDLSNINLKEYIEDLLRLLRQSYGTQSKKININLDLNDVFILIDSAIPLGLILNELISNALKHAFPEGREGELSISLNQDKDKVINIHLSDDGVGIPPGMDLRKTNSMGLYTMFSLIDYQLNGEVVYKTENGLKWHIKFKDDQYKRRV